MSREAGIAIGLGFVVIGVLLFDNPIPRLAFIAAGILFIVGGWRAGGER